VYHLQDAFPMKGSYWRTPSSQQERDIGIAPLCTAPGICEMRGCSEHC